jgi:RNA polymerase sigma factor (sigma-70 family)
MEAHAVPAPRASARRVPVRHSLLSDERLARLVSTGDERAFATLYERYHQSLYRYCRSMLRHDADAQDALQSAMTGAYAALRRAQRDAPVRPWLFRIAHNESISVLRRRRPAAELTDDLGGTVASVEDHEERRAQLALLLADLKELPERQRGALVMRELSGLSHEDIALALDTSVGGAKQAIFEARRALSEFAEGREMSCEEVCRLVSDADGRVLRARRVRAHLRECPSCSAFAAMIPGRSADLRAVAPPLPAIAAAGLLGRVIGGGSAGGGGVGLGGGAGIAGLTGKSVTVGLLTKALAGVVVLSGATVGITSAVEQPAAVNSHANPSAPLAQPAAAGSAASGTTSGRSSQIPGAPSASHRSNAAAAASFGQQTSQAAQSAVHGVSALAPRGQTGTPPVITPPVHPITPSTNAGSHGTGSTLGSTVSSTKSQQGQTKSQLGQTNSQLGQTHSQMGQTQSSQHTTTAPTQATLHQNANATTKTTPSGVLKHVAHLLG